MAFSSGIKFRCYPTVEQDAVLSSWIGCQRFIFNAKVSEERYYRTFRNHQLGLTGTLVPVDQQYSQFKDREMTPFLYDVPSQILRNGATRFMGAWKRYRAGLAERPNYKKRSGRQSVWITNELFQFVPAGTSRNKQGKSIYDHKLVLGTKSIPLGELKFKAHDEYQVPSTITVSRHAGKWYLSFSYEKSGSVMTEEELIGLYGGMTEKDLITITVGLDRGVVTPLALSAGDPEDFTKIQKKRLAVKERRKKHYQRQMARREKGSNRWKRSVQKAAGCMSYSANVRTDYAHKASRKLVDSNYEVIVFEDLKVKNLTARPEPKVSPDGNNYVPNGASAKSGLNKAILDSAWGIVRKFTAYKAQRLNKLVIAIPPHCTSQECSKCSHTHPDNRTSQSSFVCQRCGHTENADTNAAKTINIRGIRKLISGELSVKKKKRAMRLKKKDVPLREPEGLLRVCEGDISRALDSIHVTQPLLTRETPTATA